MTTDPNSERARENARNALASAERAIAVLQTAIAELKAALRAALDAQPSERVQERPELPGWVRIGFARADHPSGARIVHCRDGRWAWFTSYNHVREAGDTATRRPTAVQAAAYALGYQLHEGAGGHWYRGNGVAWNESSLFTSADAAALAALQHHEAQRGGGR